jgi:hypothetical protein
MDRKTFIKKMVGTLLIGIPAYSMLGCSSSDGSDTQPPPSNNTKDCLANGTQSSIGGNHGHTLQVSVVDVQSGSEKQYSIQGSSGHSHNITVSSANFASLKGNQQIQVTSSTGDSHTHSVTISCA